MKYLKLLVYICASSLIIQSTAEKVSYDGYKLIRVFPTTSEQIKFIHELESHDFQVNYQTIFLYLLLRPYIFYPHFLNKNILLKVDIWGSVLNGDKKSIDIMLAPSIFYKYWKIFELKGIRLTVLNENVQR